MLDEPRARGLQEADDPGVEAEVQPVPGDDDGLEVVVAREEAEAGREVDGRVQATFNQRCGKMMARVFGVFALLVAGDSATLHVRVDGDALVA